MKVESTEFFIFPMRGDATDLASTRSNPKYLALSMVLRLMIDYGRDARISCLRLHCVSKLLSWSCALLCRKVIIGGLVTCCLTHL